MRLFRRILILLIIGLFLTNCVIPIFSESNSDNDYEEDKKKSILEKFLKIDGKKIEGNNLSFSDISFYKGDNYISKNNIDINRINDLTELQEATDNNLTWSTGSFSYDFSGNGTENLEEILSRITIHDAKWFKQNDYYIYDNDGAQSGFLSNTNREDTGNISWISTEIKGPGILTFWWNVSCEQYSDGNGDKLNLINQMFYDLLNDEDFLDEWNEEYPHIPFNNPLMHSYLMLIQINNVYEDDLLSDFISGERNWMIQEIPIFNNNSYYPLWAFSKDDKNSFGQDCGWIDNVSFNKFENIDLNEAIDNELVEVRTGGDASWIGQQYYFSTDGDAAACGNLNDGEESYLSIDLCIDVPTTLSFKWNVSSEYGFDKLSFYIDGVKFRFFDGTPAEISGTNNRWEIINTPLVPGEHTLSWIYKKDSSLDYGLDAAFIDEITLIEPIYRKDAKIWNDRYPNADPFDTIADALNHPSFQQNDTIRVDAGGIVEGGFSINKPVKLIGGGDTLLFGGDYNGSSISILSDYVTISDFHIQNPGRTGLIIEDNCNNILIEDNLFNYSINGIINEGEAIIKNNNFINLRNGIELKNSYDSWIGNNNFSRIFNKCIDVYKSGDVLIGFCELEGMGRNSFYDSHIGINIFDSSFTINENDFNFCDYGILSYKCNDHFSDQLILNNNFFNIGDYDWYWDKTCPDYWDDYYDDYDRWLEHNYRYDYDFFHEFFEPGVINLKNCSGFLIEKNVIVESDFSGIKIDNWNYDESDIEYQIFYNPGYHQIINNEISFCETGVNTFYSTDNTISNNDINDNNYFFGLLFYGSSKNIIKHNNISSNGPYYYDLDRYLSEFINIPDFIEETFIGDKYYNAFEVNSKNSWYQNRWNDRFRLFPYPIIGISETKGLKKICFNWDLFPRKLP